MYSAYWVIDKTTDISCNEDKNDGHFSWSLVCKGNSLKFVINSYTGIKITGFQLHQDSQNETAICDQIVESKYWKPDNRYVKANGELPKDCFAMRHKQRLYRNTCCAECLNGQWLDHENNRCVDCEVGHECPSSLELSKNGPCRPGTFQSEPRKTNCSGWVTNIFCYKYVNIRLESMALVQT